MKIRIIASALLIMLLSVGINSKADAAPWRHGYGRGYGWGVRPVVRIGVPRIAVCAPPVVVGPAHYGGYYAPRPVYYGGPRYYGGYYGRPGYYGHGGGYYHGRGGYRRY